VSVPSTPGRRKPAQVADDLAARDADRGAAAASAWWRRVPRLLTHPHEVFVALRERDDADVHARSEPLLAIVIVAGMAGILLTPAWGRILDQPSVDGLVVAVVTFIGGVFYGAAGYFLLGLAVWLGARGMGADEPFRLARQVVGFASLPLALSLLVTLPVLLVAFGGDWFRSGGSDEGAGRWIVVGIGLAALAWSCGLLALGLRTTFRLPWRGVVGAIALAAVLVAALAVLPSAL
jgi:hypothetical protein